MSDTAVPAVHLFGIRHHGPGSARTLLAALDEVQPDAVLVELPAEAESLLAMVADPDLEPPVALLGYVPDHPERAAFYPMASFSPEWCAVQWALRHGAVLRAIDLPLANTMAIERGSATGTAGERAEPLDPIGRLAHAAGYDDPERWWEDVVEHRGALADRATEAALSAPPIAAFAAVAEGMTAVRSALRPDGAGPAAGLPSPTLDDRREAYMRQMLRGVVRTGTPTIAVVCGAWHVPALAAPLPPASHDVALLKGLAKVKVAMTWVPWTHRRLAAASGYGAGVRAPGWYAHVFAHPGARGVTAWFGHAARLLRERDHVVSPDHLIAATRLADATAALRGRPAPGLDEVLDAALAVLADGRPGPLALIHDELVVGDRLGAVPDSTPMVPLARDLLAQQKRVRLKPDATERVLELDLRTDQGRARSRLLHRLLAVGVRWGEPDAGRGSSGTFRETWRLRWDPELAVSIVEASGHGTTVEAAASSRLREQLDAAVALADLTALVERALLADLPDAIAPAMARLARRAADDPDVAHLMDALPALARALRYGDVRATDASALREVVDGIVARVVAGTAPACASLDDEAAVAMADRLSATQAALALIDHHARRAGWSRVLALVAEGATTHGLVAGRSTRLLHDLGGWDADAVGRRLSRALSVGVEPTAGAAFVEGFLAASGVVLLHDAQLLALIDRWLTGLGGDTFTDVLPLLRRTFGAFEVAERRQLGQLVAGRGDGRPPAPFGWDVDEARAEAAMATVARLLGVSP